MLIGTGVYLSGWSSKHGVDPCRKEGKMRKGGKRGKEREEKVRHGNCIQRQKDHCKFEASLGYDTKSPPPLSLKKIKN